MNRAQAVSDFIDEQTNPDASESAALFAAVEDWKAKAHPAVVKWVRDMARGARASKHAPDFIESWQALERFVIAATGGAR